MDAILLPHILQQRAADASDRWSYMLLDSQGNEQCRWTAPELAARTRAVAARIARATAPGEPVLLVFQAGPEFLAAFMACLWSGRLATPINPPRRNRLIERLEAVATDSGARVALTSSDLVSASQEWSQSSARLGALEWIATDDLPDDPDLHLADIQPDDIAFLQYTSGSTALPKGVRVSHGNLVQDMARMQSAWALGPASTMVSWLPAFHDLGLIFGLLQPLYSGCASVQMAPNAFLQKPLLWLSALSRYRGTHTAAPSFAYDLCCRRIAPQDRAGLDLSSVVMTMNAAEPINPAVLEQFSTEFQAHGFRRAAFAPAYGLAESTLAVTACATGTEPVMRCFDVAALEQGRARIVEDDSGGSRMMPGSGRPLPDVPIAIVDPETFRRCPPDVVGEIWVGGPTIAQGYWRRPEETAATFGAVIAGEDDAVGYLRTGDLGVLHEQELFVTGRIKDLIILGGANFYPHDIERAAQDAHEALRRDNGAAFAIDDPEGGREQVVLVQELERSRRGDSPDPIMQTVVQAVWQNLELPLSQLVLVPPGSVLRTSSGKIQRLANKRAFLDGSLPVIAHWKAMTARQAPPAAVLCQDGGTDAGTLTRWLTAWLADRLELPEASIDAGRGFAEMGLDSLGSTELAFALGRQAGLELPETVAYDFPSITRLINHVAAKGKETSVSLAGHAEPAAAHSQDGLIAVVGAGCRFPGACDVAGFRALLEAGLNAVGEPPEGRPERESLPPGGYIQDIECFDAAFFGVRDIEAAQMDPQHRLALEIAWHALEDAGLADAARRPRNSGVFLGISTHDYAARFHGAKAGYTPLAATGNSASAAAGRLAHSLDITGPVMAIDTACSSSLVAVQAACRSLRTGECDMALAGGVNALISDELTRGFAAAGMLSPDHACRTFDASADGYVRGEGAGFVVLKRLSDALRDGDRVRAVIRGGAVNHDGHASSLTAPNASAQAALIRAALADAGLAPPDVQVVECHGTGTPLGDPIEVQALAEVYGEGRRDPLLLGAVKTNLGHLEAAAGIAGLIKLVLALEAGKLAPTLHQSQPNPRIAWDSLPVRVIARAQDWPAAPVRLAGVSSFGFSGTNAHLILQAAPESVVVSDSPATGPLVLPFSAADQAGLGRVADRLAAWLAQDGVDVRRAVAAYARGCNTHPLRAAVSGQDAAALVAALQDMAAGQEAVGGACGKVVSDKPRVAFMFTGQGSQWAGMGKDLYEAGPVFRQAIDRCASVVSPLLGCSLTDLMFSDAPQDMSLSDTRLAQPALFTLAYALAEQLESWGVVPDVMIGHSLGEWVAACRAGVFTLDDSLRLVVERGRLMAGASQDGAMAAVFAPASCLEQLPADVLANIDLAAINAPDECVISGAAQAVTQACEALEHQGVGTQLLRTSHAFHSRLMEPALTAFASVVAGAALSKPRLPVVSNLTGTTDAPFDTVDYWVDHIRRPVRFADGVSTLAGMNVDVLIEVGASPNLTGTASRCPAFQAGMPVLVPTLRRNQPAERTLGQLLARLYVAGLPLRWSVLHGKHPGMEVPGYPFERRRHWAGLQVRDEAPHASVAAAPAAAAPAEPPQAPQDLAAEVTHFLGRSLQLAEGDYGSDRGFLEMGVDSLALTEAVAALERKWAVAIARRELFETLGTPARLVAHVLALLGDAAASVPASAVAAAPVQPRQAAPATPAAAAPVQVLSAGQQAGLAQFTQAYVQRSRASREQRSRFGPYLADSRAVAGYRPETKAMLYPIVGSRGQGSQMFDVDGNRYVDIAMGFGVQLFGHSPDFITQAIRRHIDERGLFIGPQAHLAGEVAQRLCRLTGNARAAFCNSGTEAVMTALRLARHATGRQTVVMFQGSYHGHFDGVLAQPGAGGPALPMAGGTPPGMTDDIVLLDYGDEAGALEALERLGDSVAAVLVEPVQGRRPDRPPRAFLQRLREQTRALGAALIFDEVLLGFRVALGGAQAWAGVQADLVTYGKIVGGGLPIGVVAGHARYLDALDGGAWSLDGNEAPCDKRTFFAGTFNKNPLAMAAARAVLEYLEEAGPGLQENLNRRTQDFVASLNGVLAEEDSGISVHSFASLFRFVGAGDLFYNHMIQNGVYVWEGRTCFLSTAHSDEDLLQVRNAVRESVRSMRASGMLRPSTVAAIPPSVALEPETTALPATVGQTALRLLAAFSPEAAAAYNQSLIFDFQGTLDAAALQWALHQVCARHEALRTTFPEDGATQLVHRELAPDISTLSWQDGGQAFGQWLDYAVLTPLDLEHGPMLRAWVIALAPGCHRLVLVMPHLIVDGWSLQLIALELAELYSARVENRQASLDEAVPYRRYAEYAHMQAQEPEAAAYWRSLYATQPPPLELPADRLRPAMQSYAGARTRLHVPVQLRAALETLGRQTGSSLFSVSLAAYAQLLFELSGQRDMSVAIFSAGQPELGTSALAGYCVAVLPLRLTMDPAATLETRLASTQQAVAQGVAHRGYPYSRLIKDLGLRRDPARPPLASVSFNLDRMDAAPCFAGLQTEVDANAHGAVRWDLNWNILHDADGLHIDAYYNRDLFDADSVQSWLRRYAQILESFTQAAPARSAAISPEIDTLAGKVAATASVKPGATAVTDKSGQADYATLNAMAAALAQRLQAAGVQAGDRVAFRLERGLGPVVAMLAAMRLGAAFVPLDDEHPDEHHAYVLKDSAASALIIAAGARRPAHVVAVVEWAREQPALTAPGPARRLPADATAYVLYTSGSTGRPKGVRISHGAIAAYVPAMLERLAIAGPLSFGMVSSFAADLGYTSVLGALWAGGSLHAMDAQTARDPAALQSWMAHMPVDVLKIVPTHLAALLDAPDAQLLLPRRALILGGDVLPWRLVDRMHALGAACRIFNHYGPTETTVGACMTEALDGLRVEDEHAVPVGPPLAGYRVALIDAAGRELDDGQDGEIVISGAAVALGYTQPEVVGKERFGVAQGTERCYRTGDLGRRRPDGAIVFLGRSDDMVKIRGHRIEPAGLAELLRTHAQVRDAVVLVEHREGREPALCAAVAGEVDAAALMGWLSEQVPAALVPQRWVVCAALPLTANGKVDRQTLLAGAASSTPAQDATAAPPAQVADHALDTMIDLWRAVLQCDEVGPDDDFFALGGDSIMAIQIVGRARGRGLALTPTQVFQAPTPRGLARLAVPAHALAGREVVTGPLPLTPIQRWFMDTPMPDRNRWCLTAVFALPSMPGTDRLRAAAAAVLARHDALRISWVQGPGGPVQQLVSPTPPALLRVETMPDDQDVHKAEDELADSLMSSLELSQGKVFAMGAIALPDGHARLVVVVHHGVFDMVSWSILADDLAVGLLNEDSPAAPATTRWSWWSRALPDRVQVAGASLPYWAEVARSGAATARVPEDEAEGSNLEGAVQEARLVLEAPLAQQFLDGMSAVFGLRPHEAVLAAAGLGLADWAQGSLAWELEGHGRQPFDPVIDLSRSIGWFTTRYPAVLPAPSAALQEWVVALKETLRSIPDQGMSYGVLRYGGHAELDVAPQLSFNFVGEISQFGAQAMALLRLGAGTERAADAERRHLLAFDGWLENGALVLSCRHAGRHDASTIRFVLDQVRETAQRMIDACQASAAAVYTPSDFTGISFSQNELDDLLGQITGTDSNVAPDHE
nr:non-ribosomal peptide synthetase/type I polyketide synthase [Pusillimonas sp. MFBS29]